MALPNHPPRPLSERLQRLATALDLVSKLLVFDPAKRCAAAAALAHPYVAEWREPDVEKPAGFYIDMDDIEELRLCCNLQKMFFDEVLSLHAARSSHRPVVLDRAVEEPAADGEDPPPKWRTRRARRPAPR